MFEFFNLIKADLIQVNMQNDFVHIQTQLHSSLGHVV
jgi:hypothetical protein